MAAFSRSLLSSILGASSRANSRFVKNSAIRNIFTSSLRQKEEVSVTFVKSSGEKFTAKGKVGVNLVTQNFPLVAYNLKIKKTFVSLSLILLSTTTSTLMATGHAREP